MPREIKFRSSQEFDDEDDELINPDKSQKPEESTDKSLSEEEENSEGIDLLNDPENETPLLEKDVEELLADMTGGEGRLLSAEELDKLLSEFSIGIEEKGSEAADLVEESEALVNEQLGELSGSEAEITPIKMELESASNELLGVTNDAYEEFESKRAEIVAENQKRAQELRTKWNMEEPKPIEGLAKLSKIEEELKSKSESKNEENAVPELKTESPIEDAEELKPVTVEINPVDPEPFEIDLGEDTLLDVENPSGDGSKVQIPFRSQKNVGLFGRLSSEAKMFYTDLTFRRSGKKEISRGQKMVEKSDDKIFGLNKDLLKSEDKIDELKDKLANIDEMMAKFGDDMKLREKTAIEKSKNDLDKKIKAEEKNKETLSKKIADEETNKAKLQENIDKISKKLEQAIDFKIEPYKQEVAKLEESRASLLEEKENFELVISDFENRLTGFKEQMADLDNTDMPASAKKSFKAVLNRKIKDIESALKVSRNNIAKLDDNIVRVNGRLNKEESRIGKWEGIRDDLKEVAEKNLEKEREAISRGYMPREREEQVEENSEIPEFSAESYIDKWNSFSKNDGMLLDKKLILSSKRELDIMRLESIVKTTRFKGLSERQLKKKIAEKISLLRAHFGIY